MKPSQKALPYWDKVKRFAQEWKLPFFTWKNLVDAAKIYEIEMQLPFTVIKIEKIITSCETVDHIVSAHDIVNRFEKMFLALPTISDIPYTVQQLRKYVTRKRGEIILYNYAFNPYNDSGIHPEWQSGTVTDAEGPE